MQLSKPLDVGVILPLPAIIGPLTQKHLAKIDHTDLQVFTCGPAGYMDSMQKLLAAHGVAEHAIYTESFQQAAPLLETSPGPWQRLPLAYIGSAAALVVGIGLITYGDLKKTSAKYALAQTQIQSEASTEAEPEIESDDDEPTPTPIATPSPMPVPTAAVATPAPTPARAAARVATPVPTLATPVPTPIPSQRPPRSQVS